jgi:hypothetical protein
LEPTVDDISRQFYRFLRIHSETTPEPGVSGDIPAFIMSTRDLDGKTAVGVFQGSGDPRMAESFQKWWPRDGETKAWIPPLTKLDKGAGGVRPIGRLLLHYACSTSGNGLLAAMRDIRQSLTSAFNNLAPDKKQRVAGGGDSSIECYLFGLLAGGTCSGSLVDVAYLMREGLGPINLYGAFALGDICYYDIPARERDSVKVNIQRKNTVAALAELSLLQSAVGRDIVRDRWIRRVGSEQISTGVLAKYPFERTVFVGADNDAGYTLGSFEGYQNFLADYYVQLHTSQATTQQMNRDVDEENQQLVELDSTYPTRFNQSARIGMLSLSVPVAKILVAAASKASISLAANNFKNADTSRWGRAQNEFLRQVMWHETLTLLAPPIEDLSPESFRPLPEKKDDLRAMYEQRLEDIKGRYERWKQGIDPALKTKHADFVQRWRGATEDLVNHFLGRNEGDDVSFGGLKAVVKSLLDHVSKRIDDLNLTVLERQAQLQRTGDTNPEIAFRNELDAVVADFPATSLNPITAFRRRGWSDDANLIDLLHSYRNPLRDSSIATATIRALKIVRSELEAIEVARAVIANRAGEVLSSCQTAADDAFETTKSKVRSPHEEILKRRNEVETYFVDPVLDAPESTAEVDTGGDRPSRMQVLCTAVTRGWRSEDGLPLYQSFANLAAAVLKEGVRNEEEALQNRAIGTRARSLKDQFEYQLQAALERYVKPHVEEISIWHALAEYARRQGGDVSKTLLDYFGGLQSSVGLFTKLSADSGREQGPKAVRSYYVCDVNEAEAAFRSLSIKNPELFLEKLLTQALGYAPTAMAGARPRRTEVHVLLSRRGDVPLFFDGFYKDLRELLKRGGATDPRFEKYWVDRRIPEWLEAWHNSPVEPVIPED